MRMASLASAAARLSRRASRAPHAESARSSIHRSSIGVTRPLKTITFVDPRTLLSGRATAADSISIKISDSAYSELQSGRSSIVQHLTDDDEPGNSWRFGPDVPIFEMSYEGSVPTTSGFVCVTDSVDVRPPMTWEQLKVELDKRASDPQAYRPHVINKNHSKLDKGFLIVGHILYSPSASVYTPSEQRGFLIVADSTTDSE